MRRPRSVLAKAGVGLVTLTTGASLAWASCGGTEGLVNSAVGQMASAAVAKLSATTTAIVNLDNLQTEYLIASLKVVTKQVQSSNEKMSAATVATEKSMANVNRELADKELIDKIVVDFTSQGFDPCGQSAATKKLAAAEQSTRMSIDGRMRTEIDAIGGRYGSAADTLRSREKMHRSLFCTQEEVSAGLCSSVGKIPGGDANAALIFNTDKSPEMVAAKNAVINNIIGLPDNPVPKESVGSPEAQAYMLEKKKKDAFLGFAAYSLKSIQTENEQYNPVLDERVGQFFGTQRAAAWAKDQAGQAQRGVLVDLVKIQGLNLKIRERRIRQNLRVEANLAAMLELDNQQINGPVTENAARQASVQNVSQKVK